MFRSLRLRNLLDVSRSRKDRRRLAVRTRKPVRLILESLEERLTPSGPQTAASYTDLVNAVAADTAANTNYVIQITNNFTFSSGGQVSISKLGSGSTLTIEGQDGTNYTLTGNGNRLFAVASGQTVTFTDLTLTGGSGVSTGGAIQVTSGAVHNSSGGLTLSKMIVRGNTVEGGTAEGGGIFASGAGTLTIRDSTLSDNIAQGSQGADGTAPSKSGGNGGSASGGGLFVFGDGYTVALTGDTLSGNQAIGGNGGTGAAGSAAAGNNGSGGSGGAGGAGGTATGGALEFNCAGLFSNSLTILNDSANPSTMIDNTVQAGAGGNGAAGGASTGTANNSDGGAGGAAGTAVGGAAYVTGPPGVSLTMNIGNTSFYGNQAFGGNGGAGGAAGTGGSGTAGTAGTSGGAGTASGGAMFLFNGDLTMVNSTVAANAVTAGLNGGTGVQGAASGALVDDAATTILDNNTITLNTASGGSVSSAGLAIGAGNPSLFYNLILGNLDAGSSANDLVLTNISTPLSNAANNFIGTMSTNAVSTTTSIVGNSQVQLGGVVGVDAKGNPTGGPIYYPLFSGTASIGAGTTSVLDTIASVEGTTSANATDELNNPRLTNGSINLGAVQSTISVPVISTNPISQTVTVGGTVLFTASASGTSSPTVQWQVSSDGGKMFTNLNGATSTTLTLNNVTTSMNGYQFRAVLSNSAGTVTSAAATLTVPALPPTHHVPPVLQIPPVLAFLNSFFGGGPETVNANGTETVTDSFFGFPLIVSIFDASGKLVDVTLFGIDITSLILSL